MPQSHCCKISWHPFVPDEVGQILSALCAWFAPDSLIYIKIYANLWSCTWVPPGCHWALPLLQTAAAFLVPTTSRQAVARAAPWQEWCAPRRCPVLTQAPPGATHAQTSWKPLAGWQKRTDMLLAGMGSEQINYCCPWQKNSSFSCYSSHNQQLVSRQKCVYLLFGP